jgi:hypothetical protein
MRGWRGRRARRGMLTGRLRERAPALRKPTEYWAIEVDAGEPAARKCTTGTEGAILPDNLSGTRTASDWPL